MQDAAAAQQFGVVAEPSAALRVEAAGARGERLYQVRVKVIGRGVVNRQPVGHRGAAGGEERLLLQGGQKVVAVIATQVRLARGRAPPRLEGLVAFVHARDDYRAPVDLSVADVEADGRDKTRGPARQPLLEFLRVGQVNRMEPRPLVQAEDDGPAAEDVGQRAQRRSEALRQAARSGLDLYAGVVAARHAQFGSESGQILSHAATVPQMCSKCAGTCIFAAHFNVGRAGPPPSRGARTTRSTYMFMRLGSGLVVPCLT